MRSKERQELRLSPKPSRSPLPYVPPSLPRRLLSWSRRPIERYGLINGRRLLRQGPCDGRFDIQDRGLSTRNRSRFERLCSKVPKAFGPAGLVHPQLPSERSYVFV